MVGFFSIGLGAMAAKVIRTAFATADWRALSSLLALSIPLALALVVLRFFFRQQPIWGSPEGLVVGTGRRARQIPWSKIGPPEWAWYAFDTPTSLSVAFVEVDGEARRVFFYASDESIERLSSLREQAVAPVRSEAMSGVTSAPAERRGATRPAYPFLVFPVVIALIVVVNAVLQLLQAGYALLAVALLLAITTTGVLLVALRRPSNE
jgi:hypothetical protein